MNRKISQPSVLNPLEGWNQMVELAVPETQPLHLALSRSPKLAMITPRSVDPTAFRTSCEAGCPPSRQHSFNSRSSMNL